MPSALGPRCLNASRRLSISPFWNGILKKRECKGQLVLGAFLLGSWSLTIPIPIPILEPNSWIGRAEA